MARKQVGNRFDPEGLLAYANRYLQHRKITGSSEQAVDTARRMLHDFIEWCDTRGLRRPTEITKPILERYQRFLFYYRKVNGDPLSISSQLTKLTPVRSYFKWLAKQNYILYDPASALELPKKRKNLPKVVLTAAEMEAVMRVPDIHTIIGLRDRTMLEVLYATGIRRNELRQLTIDSIDLKRQTLFVHQGKGYKDRILPLGDRATYWLVRYLEDSRPRLETPLSGGCLFLSHLGRQFNLAWIGTTVGRLIRKAGLKKTGGCHLIRHTMATLMLENGADIRYIQSLLGHEDPKTTQIYTQVSTKQLAKVHAMTHPGKLSKRYRIDAKLDQQAAFDQLMNDLADEDDECIDIT